MLCYGASWEGRETTHLERLRGGSPEREFCSMLEARWCTHSAVSTPPSGHVLGAIDMFRFFCKSANVIRRAPSTSIYV